MQKPPTLTPHGVAFSEAAAAEQKAFIAAQNGEQLARLAHFRLLTELVNAQNNCDRAVAAKASGVKIGGSGA